MSQAISSAGQQSASFAVRRVDRLIGRAFAAASVLLGAETATNLIAQMPLLQPNIVWPLAIGLWLTQALMIFTFWFGRANKLWLQVHAAYMILLLLTWPLQAQGMHGAPATFVPWLWWAFDTGWIAAALSFKMRWVSMYFATLVVGSMAMMLSPIGGAHTVPDVVQSAAFSVLSNGSVAVIALMLKNAAARTDRANEDAISARAANASTDAQSRERARVDALVHDSVLTALISASNATTKDQVAASANLARDAIERLKSEFNEAARVKNIYVSVFFDALTTAAKKLDENLDARATIASPFLLQTRIADGLTEACLQAISNSVTHAGAKANRELILKASERSLKIVVKDNGRGFRPSSAARGRLGIRNSIIGRTESVGGQVHIDSAPGKGASIIIEWIQK
jgi:signal transduction histidine kinase